MKTLKSILAVVALLFVVNVVKANDDTEKLTKDHAITTYVEAMTRGKLEGFNQVLDNSVKFSMMRGKSVLTFNKSEMIDYLKENKNTQQQACTVNTTTVESNGEVAIVKVDFAYEGFTRSNLVTVSNTGNGWKITNVHSTFK